MNIIQSVPTNIITGFLGVGKTTSINYLLTHKPEQERWAVLVNEFGEIGVDASLIGSSSSDEGVYIKEVVGGCMCCTSGLPMQIALNRLLAEAKPDRLLIEPTGLGHPKEVLETLSAPHYQQSIKLQATITLVDARNLNDARYTTNDTFIQQFAVADLIVGNKSDIYYLEDKQRLREYAKTFTDKEVQFVEQGQLDYLWLMAENKFAKPQKHAISPNSVKSSLSTNALINPLLSLSPPLAEVIIDEDMDDFSSDGILYKHNKQGDFESFGWCIRADKTFSRLQVSVLLMGLQVERAKAVFITDEGVFGYNKTEHGLTEQPLDEVMDSRLELVVNITNQMITKEETENALINAMI